MAQYLLLQGSQQLYRTSIKCENRLYFNFRIMVSAMKARILDEREAFRKCLFQRWDWSLDLNDEEIVA